MIPNSCRIIILVAVLTACVCAGPASAVILEVTSRGTVSGTDPVNGTITISNPEQYGCTYISGGEPQCTFTPVDSVPLTGTVPDKAVFPVIRSGDRAVVTALGGPDGRFIAVAKLAAGGTGAGFVTALFGDPSTIPVPFIGDYAVTAQTLPDCGSCTGTVCNASLANVTVLSSGTPVLNRNLAPGETLFFNGRNDASSVTVTFVSGEASSSSCPATEIITGPQPVSDFIVTVVPPIGMQETGTPVLTTAAATPVEPAGTYGTTAVPGTAATKSGSPVPAGITGILAAGLLAALGKRHG